MESVCRGCNQQSNTLTSIFVPYTMGLFQQCTSLNICNDDGLPAFICKLCNDLCEQWLKFKEMCHQNDDLFRQNKYKNSWQLNNTIPNENIKIELPLTLKQEFSSPINRLGLVSNDIGIDEGNDDDDDDCDKYVDDHINDNNDDVACDNGNDEPMEIKQNTNNIENAKDDAKISKTKKTTTKKEPKVKKKVTKLQCDECSKMFSSRSSIKKHLKRHGERLFICSYCGIRFHTNWCLNQHTRIHTGDKPYKCDLCSSAFTRSGNLVVHRRKHTQEKPYKCEKCVNSYFTNQQLKFHIIATHSSEQQPFACDFCTAKYKCEAILKRHKRMVHGCY